MTKKIHFRLLVVLAAVVCGGPVRAESVAINADSSLADPSAILDLKSSKKGLLILRPSNIKRALEVLSKK